MRWPGLPREAWGQLTALARRVEELSNLRVDESLELQGGPQPTLGVSEKKGMWVRITGGDDPYTAVSIFEKTAGEWASVSQINAGGYPYVEFNEGVPLYEINGNDKVPQDTVVWAEPHGNLMSIDPTTQGVVEEWQFEYSAGGPGTTCESTFVRQIYGPFVPEACGLRAYWKLVQFPCGNVVEVDGDPQIGSDFIPFTSIVLCGECCEEPPPSSSSSSTQCDIVLYACFYLDRGFQGGDGICVTGGCYSEGCVQVELASFDTTNECSALYLGDAEICGDTYTLTLIQSKVDPKWTFQAGGSGGVAVWTGSDYFDLQLDHDQTTDPTCDWQEFLELVVGCNCPCPNLPYCWSLPDGIGAVDNSCDECTTITQCLFVTLITSSADPCLYAYVSGSPSFTLCDVDYQLAFSVVFNEDTLVWDCTLVISQTSDPTKTVVYVGTAFQMPTASVTLVKTTPTVDTLCDWPSFLEMFSNCCGSSSSSSSGTCVPSCYSIIPLVAGPGIDPTFGCPVCTYPCVEMRCISILDQGGHAIANNLNGLSGDELCHPTAYSTGNPANAVIWSYVTRFGFPLCGDTWAGRYTFKQLQGGPNAGGYAHGFSFVDQSALIPGATYSATTAPGAWSPGQTIVLSLTNHSDGYCQWPNTVTLFPECCGSSSSSACGVCSDIPAFVINGFLEIEDLACINCQDLEGLCLQGTGCQWSGTSTEFCGGLNNVILTQVAADHWTLAIGGNGCDGMLWEVFDYDPSAGCHKVVLSLVDNGSCCTNVPLEVTATPLITSPVCCIAPDPCGFPAAIFCSAVVTNVPGMRCEAQSFEFQMFWDPVLQAWVGDSIMTVVGIDGSSAIPVHIEMSCTEIFMVNTFALKLTFANCVEVAPDTTPYIPASGASCNPLEFTFNTNTTLSAITIVQACCHDDSGHTTGSISNILFTVFDAP